MKLEKCPICSTKMKEQTGRMVCPQCGYYQITDRNASTPAPAPMPGPASAWPPYNGAPSGPVIMPGPQQESRTRGTINVTASPRNNSFNVAALIGWISAVLLVVICVSLLIFLNRDKEMTADSSAVESVEESEEYDSSDYLPRSESYQALIAQIFDKNDYTEVTRQEIQRITELDFYYDEDSERCLLVTLDDGTTLDYFLNTSLNMDNADLSCFSGVTDLTLEYGYLSEGDLHGMANLTSIASDLSLDELYDQVPYPENIQSIELLDTFFSSDCEGIQNFPNLKAFSAESGIEDIGALSEMTKLEALYLGTYDVVDFSPLYKLTGLKALALDASRLKDISFIQSMPELRYLSIANTDELKSIQPLEGCAGTLEQLFLSNTWGIEDYSVIEQLTSLTQLQLCVSYEDTLPSFAGLQNLEYLELYGADDLRAIGEAKGLIYLSLDSCNCEDMTFLSGLQNLEILDLYDMSGYFVSLQPVTQLPKLRILDISDSTAYTDAAVLLGIPTLEEFYMSECNIGFNPGSVPANANLKVLDMNYAEIFELADSNYGWLQEATPVALSEHAELFANFPNLEVLRLQGQELDNLSFVEENELTHLQILDIEDNYVLDLSPLAGLTELQYVYCGNNPIADTAGLDDILVR